MSYIYSAWSAEERILANLIEISTGKKLERIIEEWQNAPCSPSYDGSHAGVAAYRVPMSPAQYRVLTRLFTQLVLGIANA